MFTFLGTSAAEQYPALWCNCCNCQIARKLQGRNIRKNSSGILGDHTLIDFGPTITAQLAELGFSLLTIDSLLVTHAHQDHFFPWYLRWRLFPDPQLEKYYGKGPVVSKPRPLIVYGNEDVRQQTLEATKQRPEDCHLEIVVLEPWQRFTTEHLHFIPVRANHALQQDSYNFIIEYLGKNILYAVDTAWFLEETMEFLKDYKFDVVIMDGTFGFNDKHDSSLPGHCDFFANRRARQWMLKENMITENTPFVITHIGHHAPPHDECSTLLSKWDLILAYDGMEIKL